VVICLFGEKVKENSNKFLGHLAVGLENRFRQTHLRTREGGRREERAVFFFFFFYDIFPKYKKVNHFRESDGSALIYISSSFFDGDFLCHTFKKIVYHQIILFKRLW
jgi:hypothetical protein